MADPRSALPPSNPLVELFYRLQPWIGVFVIAAGTLSPLWGVGVGRFLRWPHRITAGAALGPIGALLLAGILHDGLQRHSRLPARTAARIEMASSIAIVNVVLTLPLVRYYAGRRGRGTRARDEGRPDGPSRCR